MANHSLPTTTSTYTNFVNELDSRLDDLALGLDPARTTMTNLPTNSVGWSSSESRWKLWNGSSWVDLSATYSINISGTATSAATLTTARTINGVSFNGSANITVEPFVEQDVSTNATRYIAFVDSSTAGHQRLNLDTGLTYNPSTNTLTATTFSGALSGNATTATTLANARTINGVSFNGSANITVNTQQSVTFNNGGAGAASGATFNGGSAVTVSYNTVGAPSTTGTGASGTWGISITGNAATVTNGVYTTGDQTIGGAKTFSSVTANSAGRYTTNNAGIGMYEMHLPAIAARAWYVSTDGVTRLAVTNGSGTASTVQLAIDASSNFTATGNVTAFSDIRLKTDLAEITDALWKVKQLSGYTYTRIDTGERQTGVVAQEVQAVLPEAVIDNGETLAVAYGNMVGLLIEAVKELTARVEKLEGR